MRTNKIAILTLAVALLVSASSAHAVISESDIKFLDFTGWNDVTLSGGGTQSFIGLDAGIFGLINVDVTEISGVGDPPSAAVGTNIQVNRPSVGSHSYKFTFSQSLPLIFTHANTDPEESFSLNTIGPEAYMQTAGNPVIFAGPDPVMITGTAYGFNPNTGVAAGQLTDLDGSIIGTITYGTTGANKYDTVRVGVLIPEPNTSALAGIGLVGLAFSFRRRKK